VASESSWETAISISAACCKEYVDLLSVTVRVKHSTKYADIYYFIATTTFTVARPKKTAITQWKAT